MTTNKEMYMQMLERLLEYWEDKCPLRWTMLRDLENLIQERTHSNIETIFDRELTIFTATIDDGWGLGLDVIHKACDALGVKYRFLGLLVKPYEIINECAKHCPDFLGLTVLHDSSREDLLHIASEIPESTTLLVGGRNFHLPNVIFIPNVAFFMKYLLEKCRIRTLEFDSQTR